jgi:hypothetical protein
MIERKFAPYIGLDLDKLPLKKVIGLVKLKEQLIKELDYDIKDFNRYIFKRKLDNMKPQLNPKEEINRMLYEQLRDDF